MFSLPNYRLPFEYGYCAWRTVVETDNGVLLPVEVNPDSPSNTQILHVKVFGDVGKEEKRLIDRTVRSVFCTEVALQKNHHVFHNGFGTVFTKYYGLKPHLSQDPFQSLVKIIIRQLIGAEHAKRVITSLTKSFGKKMAIDGLDFFAFPTAKRLSHASRGELLSCGVGYKWRYIQELSKEVIDGDLDLSRLRTMSNDKVIEELEERVGIGLWSSRVFLFDGLHRLNTYPVFDITIQRALMTLRGSEKQIGDDDGLDWKSFGPDGLVGFYATYLFAYFREMVKVDPDIKGRWQVHRF